MRHTVVFALVLSLGLSACGGGGGSAPTPIANSAGGGTTTPATSTVIPLSASPLTAALPSVAGIGGTVSLPAIENASAGSTVTVSASTTDPSADRVQQSALRQTQGGTLTFFVFYAFTVNVTTTFKQLPGFTITLPSSIPTAGQQFFYAVSNPTATNVAIQFLTEGPATVNGQQLTFAASNDSLTLNAGTRYVFAFYSTSRSTPQQSALYVTNPNTPSVTVYDVSATGNAAPIRTISGNLTQLQSGLDKIAVDRTGAAYVGSADAVLVFAPGANGNVAPARTLSGPLTGFAGSSVVDLALDAADNLYVLIQGNSGTGSIAFFPAGSNGNVAPSRLITGGNTGLGPFVRGLAVDTNGDVFASTTGANAIVEFASNANGNVTPVRTIGGAQTGLSRVALGLATDAHGNLYATQPFSVQEFGPSQSGNVAPIASFPDALPSVGNTGVVIDANGQVFVATLGIAPGFTGTEPPTISTFSSNNVVPAIVGSATALNQPYGVAMGPR